MLAGEQAAGAGLEGDEEIADNDIEALGRAQKVVAPVLDHDGGARVVEEPVLEQAEVFPGRGDRLRDELAGHHPLDRVGERGPGRDAGAQAQEEGRPRTGVQQEGEVGLSGLPLLHVASSEGVVVVGLDPDAVRPLDHGHGGGAALPHLQDEFPFSDWTGAHQGQARHVQNPHQQHQAGGRHRTVHDSPRPQAGRDEQGRHQVRPGHQPDAGPQAEEFQEQETGPQRAGDGADRVDGCQVAHHATGAPGEGLAHLHQEGEYRAEEEGRQQHHHPGGPEHPEDIATPVLVRAQPRESIGLPVEREGREPHQERRSAQEDEQDRQRISAPAGENTRQGRAQRQGEEKGHQHDREGVDRVLEHLGEHSRPQYLQTQGDHPREQRQPAHRANREPGLRPGGFRICAGNPGDGGTPASQPPRGQRDRSGQGYG